MLCRLFVIYGPGSITERELGLRNIAEPPAGSTVQDSIEHLRRWQRWCGRMKELGGVLPDSALQVRALSKITRAVLAQHPEVAFRVNLARASLQIDLTPDDEKVQKLHAQLLGELEAMAHRGDKDKDRPPKDGTPAAQAKVKGVEAPASSPSPPKGPKPPKPPPKAAGTAKAQETSETSGSGKMPCSFYTGHNGCKKGKDCGYEHDWSSFTPAERALRCKNCGGKTHKAAECRAGIRPEDAKSKSKAGKAPNPPKQPPGSSPVPPPPQPASDTNQQQIKSLLADAARILQQTMPSPNVIDGQNVPVASATQGLSGPPSAKASAPPPVQGTPVTLASLSAQLDSLRAMTRDPEVKVCVARDSAEECFPCKPKDALGFPADVTMKFLRDQMNDLRLMVKDFEVKTCKEGGDMPSAPTALLDSGATHAVISFRDNLQDLEKVPVTLAGDERQEWLRTPGGTLVVPPDPTASSSRTGQTILPLGALVESLGCQVTWTRRRGLKVVHPTLGTLRTRISDNTCPYVEEDQALRLIAELEDKRLARFKERVQNLECHLESYEAPLDPTESLRRFINSGDRLDALKAFLVQPYLLELPDHVRADLAETIPCATPGADKAVLKLLPLKRAARRSLLESPRWAVHLCSGSHCGSEPLSNWARERGLAFLQVDLRQPGGKGWDLSRQVGIWKVLLWAAAQGRVAAVLSSPPSGTTSEIARLEAQGMILWSLASVSREEGIP